MPRPNDTKLLACIWHRFDQWRFPPWLAEEIRARYPGINVVRLPDFQGLDEEVRDADIFIGWALRPEQLASARRLKWLHCPAAGVDHLVLRADVRRSPVIITNARHVHAPVMAEHTLTLILALARRLPSAVDHQRRRHWAQQDIWNEQPHPMEIAGRTLLIVGYGAIGQELGRRARACEMRVVGVKRDLSRGAEHADKVVSTAELNTALHEADFVVAVAPLLPETKHLFNHQRFAAMKRTAYFINVGRGGLVEEKALTAALKDGLIAGAAIDVAEAEPLPPDSPLWSAPSLLITPHLAGASEKLWQRHAELLFQNLDRYFAGEPLLNVVDKERGY